MQRIILQYRRTLHTDDVPINTTVILYQCFAIVRLRSQSMSQSSSDKAPKNSGLPENKAKGTSCIIKAR